MNKFHTSQILMLLGLTTLLILTPLLSSSLRPTYLYFIFNLLIISLGADAGLLSTAVADDKKPAPSSAPKPSPRPGTPPTAGGVPETSLEKPNFVEKSEKIPGDNAEKETMKKCRSSTSIFFIGEAEETAEEAEEEAGGGVLNGQELFTQAEMFIGNFYKQLKMQREESWKNIHGFYQKGF